MRREEVLGIRAKFPNKIPVRNFVKIPYRKQLIIRMKIDNC